MNEDVNTTHKYVYFVTLGNGQCVAFILTVISHLHKIIKNSEILP